MTKDGQFGISSSTDGTTTLWDLNTGKLIRRYQVSPFTLLFTPDNRSAIVGIIATNRIESWRLDATLDELLAWTHANRYIPELTCQQRELYRLESLCEPESANS
jgi:WD40 repeat protein